jgi:cysteine desulfurase / selenocysteine lyase
MLIEALKADVYDIERIREDFPILKRAIHGRPVAYLDSAASAQKPRTVLEQMEAAAYSVYANVHRGSHTLGNLSTERFEAARETVRAFLNAGSADEIVFTKSATEAINLVASSFGRAFLSPGDEILVSTIEHHANIVPWHMLRDQYGIDLKWIDIRADGQFDLDQIERAMTPRTKMVAVTHMSNVIGALTPIAEIVKIAHDRGVPVLVDGSQAAVHTRVDVQALGVDFYAVTAHKLYGPTGIGALYGKSAWLQKLPPFLGGGEMVVTVDRCSVSYADPPHRFEAGTPAILESIGWAAALDYIELVGRDRIAAHEAALGAYARERLAVLPYVRVLGDARAHSPILTFVLDDAHAHDVAVILDSLGICIRAGAHCAQPLLARLGLSSTCRASIAMYTSKDEIDRLVAGIASAHALLA